MYTCFSYEKITHKVKFFFTTLFLTGLVFLPAAAFSANPPAPFSPQDNILDPNCLPSDSNCYIRQDNQVLTNATATTLYAAALSALSVYFSGNVGIGTSTPSQRLDVWGNLKVATGSIPTLFVDSQNQRIYVGTSTDFNNGINKMYVVNSDIFSPGNSSTALRAESWPSVINARSNGIVGYSVAMDGATSTSYMAGADLRSIVRTNLETQDTAYGITAAAYQQGTGTTTNAYGISVLTGNYGATTGTIQNGYGLYASVARGSGNLRNSYGLYINSSEGTSASYGVYQNGGLMNYFAGNVGIGSTTPSSRLAVTGTAGVTSSVFTVASSTGSSLFSVLPNGNIAIGSSSSNYLLYINGKNDTSSNSYNPKIQIDGDGSKMATMGIGGSSLTSSYAPSYLFIGNSNIASSSGSGGGTIILNNYRWNGTSNLANNANDVLGEVAFRGSTPGGLQNTAGIQVRTLTGTDAVMYFRIQDNTGASSCSTPRMALTSLGNLGIGTDGTPFGLCEGNVAPFAKLAVQGTYGSTLPVFSVASTTSGSNATTSLFTVLANGNVGINASNPQTPLSVSGTNSSNIASYFFSSTAFAGGGLSAYRARGTYANPQSVQNYDILGGLLLGGYDGSNYLNTAYILANNSSNGGVSSGTIPTDLQFWTGSTNANVASRMTINYIGNIGIGTTTPSSKLDVYSATSTSNIDVFRLLTDVGGTGNVKFRIDSDGDIFTDGGTTIGNPADVAESFSSSEVIVPGTVVAMASTTSPWSLDENNQASTTYNLSEIRTAHNGDNVFGVVSTRPGILLGGNTTNGIPVALSGRVPVKVTTENGEVRRGDYLTLSTSTPGHAMKMVESGKTIGRALSDSQTEQDTVLVFIENKDRLFTVNGTEGLRVLTDKPAPPSQTVLQKIASLIAEGEDSISSFTAIKVAAVIAYIDTIFVNDIHVKNSVCIGSTCITESQLKNMLHDDASSHQEIASTTPAVVNEEQVTAGTTTQNVSTTTELVPVP